MDDTTTKQLDHKQKIKFKQIERKSTRENVNESFRKPHSQKADNWIAPGVNILDGNQRLN